MFADDKAFDKWSYTVDSSESTLRQLFKLIADPPATGEDDTVSMTAPDGEDVVFGYHAGTAAAPGWVLLQTEEKSETDEYVFGYNQKMTPQAETKTLFDKVQLKSFIDGEYKGDVAVGVYGYGIQANKLRPNSVTQEAMDAPYLTKETMQGIYAVVKNKAEGSGTS